MSIDEPTASQASTWPAAPCLIQVNVKRHGRTYISQMWMDEALRSMQYAGAWQRGHDMCRGTPFSRRWLVLLVALAFAAAGLSAGPYGAASSHPHDALSMSGDAGGGPGRADAEDHPQCSICSLADGCPLDVPLAASVAFGPSASVPAEMPPESARNGTVPLPHFHPPERSSSV